MIENISKEGDFMKENVSVSILDSKNIKDFVNNLKNVKDNISSLKTKANLLDIIIHFDVMDGKFVKPIGIDVENIKYAKELGFYADVHLMVANPIQDKYIDNAIKYGADSITIHYEIEEFDKSLKYLLKKKKELLSKENRNLEIGVSIKPNTQINVLKKYINKIDKILIMTVEPGKGGQKYIDKCTDKITFARSSFGDVNIEIDGGVNPDTICRPLRDGANSFVIGSFLSKSLNYEELYSKFLILNAIFTIEMTPRKANLKLDSTTLQVVPGGYGENDILLGINVPDIRKCSNLWYKELTTLELEYFITSRYHDYRRFAVFCIISKVSILYKESIKDKKNKQAMKELKQLFTFFEHNLRYINNWDLTDVAGPNILAYNLFILNSKDIKKKLTKYLSSNNFWIKRIGIVSMLTFARNNELTIPLKVCDAVIYDEFHLFQKATGWVLREMYKKQPNIIVNYLSNKNRNKKLPGILLSYACEKMSISEKEKIKMI